MKAIGVGCFWFADAAGEPDDYEQFSPAEHLAQITSALEGVDSVSNFKISRQGESYVVSGDSFYDEDDNQNYFPLIDHVTIQFDLFLPDRLQEKYGLGRLYDKGVDNFHIRIVFEGGLPITYIYYDVNGSEADCLNYNPSTAVIFVREYLEEKLRGHDKIEFQSLGPSPFHADLFVRKSSNDATDPIAKDLSIPGFGYRTLYFELPTPDEELIDLFIALNHHILSAYYNVVKYRNRSLHLSNHIENGVQLLVAASQAKGIRAITQWFRYGPIIDAVYKSILDQKMNRIGLARFLAQARADEIVDESNIIFPSIQRESDDKFAIPIDEVKDLLKMMEDRRQAYIRNTTTIASGLIGGIIGASLTFLFGFYSPNTKPQLLPSAPPPQASSVKSN